MLITPFALVQPIEDLAAEAIERGDLPAALMTLITGVEGLVARDDLAGRLQASAGAATGAATMLR